MTIGLDIIIILTIFFEFILKLVCKAQGVTIAFECEIGEPSDPSQDKFRTISKAASVVVDK